MNDDTLTTALDRMATALEPPTAADQLIDTRRGQLRRRRRVATGLAATSVVAIVATGGVLASSFGNAGPQPDNTPMTSGGPTPSEAVDDETDTAPEVRENDGPWRCSGAEPMTPQEVEVFRNEVIDEAQLGMDLVDDKVRAYVVLGDKSDAVYQLEARRLPNREVEIVAVVRCAG